MNVEYSANEVTVDYARWNDRSKTYNSNVEKAVYALNDNNATLLLASTK